MTILSAEITRPEVLKAIAAIRSHFGDDNVQIWASKCGGAHVLVKSVTLGPPFQQDETWIAFFITNACPYADVYPFYVRHDLVRIDGAELKSPLHLNRSWEPDIPNLPARPAVMVSRRGKSGPNLGLETPLIKLLTVIKWLRTR